MKEPNYGRKVLKNILEIKDVEQARLLSNPESFKYFEPFIARDCTVSQAAKELGCNVDTMLYRVKTFLNAGLLKVGRLEPRRGRPIKVYRSSVDAYYIPFELTPFEDIEAQVRQWGKASEAIIVPNLAKVIRQLGREGRQIYRNEQGDVSTTSAGNRNDSSLDLNNMQSIRRNLYDAKRPIGESSSDILKLTDKEARDLMFELYKLWGKCEKVKMKGKRKSYFFGFSFVPMDD